MFWRAQNHPTYRGVHGIGNEIGLLGFVPQPNLRFFGGMTGVSGFQPAMG